MVDVLSTMYGTTSLGCVTTTGAIAKKQLDEGKTVPETLTSTGIATAISSTVGGLANSIIEHNYENAKEKYAANAIVAEQYVEQMSDEELIQALEYINDLSSESNIAEEQTKTI